MNHYLLKFYTAITLIILLISCSNDIPESNLVIKDGLLYERGSDVPFTGREKAKIENKIIDYEVVNGVKHGEFKLYFEDGTLEIKGNIENNRNTGKWQYYYPSGELEVEGYFVDDSPEGRWVWFYPSGKTKEEGNYTKGIRIGWWKLFEEDGTLIMEQEYTEQDSVIADNDSTFRKFIIKQF